MANINPFEKSINTQGNTQYFGVFSNRQIQINTTTGGSASSGTVSYKNLIGTRSNGAYARRRRQGTSLIGLYEPPNVIKKTGSDIVWGGTPLVRIKLNIGYWCVFLGYTTNNTRLIRAGFYTSDTAEESTSGIVDGRVGYAPDDYTAFVGCDFGTFRHENKDYVGVFFVFTANNGTEIVDDFYGINRQELLDLGASSIELSETFGEPSKEEGYTNPTFDDSSDTISVPKVPIYGATSGGFINAYSVTTDELVNIGAELFPNIEIDYTEGEIVQQTLVKLGNQIGAIFKNNGLINYVLDCHILPVSPTVGNRERVKVGYKSLSQCCLKASSDYVDVDCGNISITEYYNNFIDYITTAKLYLPFIGFVPVKPEFFQNGNLAVKYRFNIVDGSFMCYILSTSSKSNLTNSVVATYSGVACSHIPLSGSNYAAMVSGIINGGASTLANISSGNILGGLTSAMNTIANKPDMQQSNGFNSSSALLSPRKPYLLIERPVSNISERSPKEKGFPLNVTYKLSDITGYTELDNVVVAGITATTSEQDELKKLLESGVIL